MCKQKCLPNQALSVRWQDITVINHMISNYQKVDNTQLGRILSGNWNHF